MALPRWILDRDASGRGRTVTALYRRLAPGSHVFRCSAANSLGNRGGHAPGLEIRVAPYWWQYGSVQTPGILTALTAAKRRVLRLIASGRTGKEIAAELGLSGAHSLVKFAFEHRDAL